MKLRLFVAAAAMLSSTAAFAANSGVAKLAADCCEALACCVGLPCCG